MLDEHDFASLIMYTCEKGGISFTLKGIPLCQSRESEKSTDDRSYYPDYLQVAEALLRLVYMYPG